MLKNWNDGMKTRMNKVWMLAVVGCLILFLLTATKVTAQEEPPNVQSQNIDVILRDIATSTESIKRETDAMVARAKADRGICQSNNFSVICVASQLDSRDVLARAEQLRKQLATEMLGSELPEGAEFTIIHVNLSNDQDEGVTLLANEQVAGHHRVWLTTDRDRALGSTLAHELAHVVLNAQFPDGMPAWASEGLASLYDDADRKAIRQETLESFARSGQWPFIGDVLNRRQINQTDVDAYTVSTSLAEFCLTKGDRQRFVRFARDGAANGWDAAVQQHYGLANVREFQQQWERWVRKKLSGSATELIEAIIAIRIESPESRTMLSVTVGTDTDDVIEMRADPRTNDGSWQKRLPRS